MKYQNCIFIFMAVSITSCQNNTNTLSPQGRVKFESISLAPKLGGRIQQLLVTEGQQVKKGDTLAILDIPEIGAKMQQADGAILAAQGQLDLAVHGATIDQIAQIENQLSASKEQAGFAEKSYARMRNMYEDSLIPAQQYDEVKMKLEASRAQVKVLEARKAEIVKGARPENKRSLEGQLERAKGAKNETLLALDEKYLLAPDDMSIETISLKEGELALPGYTIFSGLKKASVYFRFTVNETQVNAFRIGQEVMLTVPNTSITVKGKITAVKQLSRYADNTSTSPGTELGQAMYELKIIPVDGNAAKELYNNSTILLTDQN
jgi:HlyD family secretion protein